MKVIIKYIEICLIRIGQNLCEKDEGLLKPKKHSVILKCKEKVMGELFPND